MIVLLPQQRLAVVTLANANNELPLPGGASALQRIPRGVVSLLLGEEPETGTTLTRLYIVFDTVVALTLVALGWALIRLLRRRHLAVRPRRRLLAVARGTAETALGALLVAAPALSGYGYAGALLWTPDLTVVLLVTGGLLALMGATRIALRLRAPTAPAAAMAVNGRVAGPASPASRRPLGSGLSRRPRLRSRVGRGRNSTRAHRSPAKRASDSERAR